MTFVPVMWTIWAALVVISSVLYLYRSRLSRDEDTQVFLDDSFNEEKAAQEAIVAKVNKIQPALHLALWFLAAATIVVIVYYILEFIHRLS
jgi:hypothetical protein